MLRALFLIAVAGAGVACGGNVAKEDAVESAGRAGESEGGNADQAGSAGAFEQAGAPSAGAGEGGSTGGFAGSAGMPSRASVAISEISLWQAVRIPLAERGQLVEPNAPIIQGKEAMVRVYVEPDAGFEPRSLTAVLSLASLGAPLTSRKLIRARSVHGDFGSTFNFPLAGGDVPASTRYSVTVRDDASDEVLARFPKRDLATLTAMAVSKSNALELVIVPIVASGILPDTSAKTLDRYRARLLSMYPLGNVALSVHAPITTALTIGPEAGWEDLLEALYALRAQDKPAANIFYYGLFTPTPTFDEYCVTDCTVGLSALTDPDDVEERGSIGLGIFADGSNEDAPDTLAHELGHALGRDHAPCDVALEDTGYFPYPGGKVGVWGYDGPHHRLIDPARYGDVMGYCLPDWISDFTYQGLFTRLRKVNGEVMIAQALEPGVGAHRRVLVRADGSLGWGARLTPRSKPGGATRSVFVTRADGREQRLGVPFRRFGDRAGGFLLVPERMLAGALRLRVGNALLALPTP